MATPAQITRVRLRQPQLPGSITDDVVNIYLDDAAGEFPFFGIDPTDPDYDKMLSLYALHLMTMANLISHILSEAVKDVSASYLAPVVGDQDSIYYREFKRMLRRRKFPGTIMFNS